MRIFIGIFFVAASLLRLAELLGIINVGWLWKEPYKSYYFPLLVLYIGMEIVFCGLKNDRHEANSLTNLSVRNFHHNPEHWLQRPLPSAAEGKRICCSTRYGCDAYIYRGELFHGARLNAYCGGIRLDLRNAVIEEDEEIDIQTIMGGVELLVPQNVKVRVKSRNFVGGISNETTVTEGPDNPCLHIIASNFLGGVSIKNI